MTEIIERLVRVETKLAQNTSILAGVSLQVAELHSIILKNQGAEQARADMRQEKMHEATVRHYGAVALSAVGGGIAGAIASLIALLNRYSPAQ